MFRSGQSDSGARVAEFFRLRARGSHDQWQDRQVSDQLAEAAGADPPEKPLE